MKYYLIAGEASGDMHASLLMEALVAKDPEAQFRYWGGERMESVAPGKVRDIRDTAVMGIVEVLSKAGRISRNLDFCKADIIKFHPDAVILIDYPGFNLRIARFAHENGFKVFYYIAPKVWASRESRVKQLKRYVDRLLVIFPFEVEWFRSRGIEPVYEGNPLADSIQTRLEEAPSREVFLNANGLEDKPVIALLAGSRLQEIRFLAPRFNRLAHLLSLPKSPLRDRQLVIAAAPGIAKEVYESHFGLSGIKVVYNATYPLIKYADAAVVASGTASLETAIIGTPQVVCYGMNPLSFHIAMAILKVKYVSLANLIMDRPVFKELLQEKCTPEAIAAELERISTDPAVRAAMQQDYASIRSRLGTPGAANRYADHIIKSIAR